MKSARKTAIMEKENTSLFRLESIWITQAKLLSKLWKPIYGTVSLTVRICCKSGWTIIQLIHLIIWYFGVPIASFWVLGFYILSIVSKIKNRLPIISTADTLDTQCIFAVSVSIVAYVFSNAIIDIPIFLYTPIYLGRVHILRHSWSTMHHI